MPDVNLQHEEILKKFRLLAEVPALSSATLNNNNQVVTALWSQRNLEKGKMSKFYSNYVLSQTMEPLLKTMPIDATNEVLSAVSPTGNLRAALQSVWIDKTSSYVQILEIWSRDNLLRSVDLSAVELHGDIYSSAGFSTFSWSPNEKKIVYIAEKKPPKMEPFYKRKSQKPQDGSGENNPIKGREYAYKEDWGEQYVGKISSVVAVYDLETDSVQILKGVPEELCPSQVAWSPDASYLLGTALNSSPRKLGAIYCSNRKSHLFTLDLEGNFQFINDGDSFVTSPLVSPDGKYFLWFERSIGGPHWGCMKLCKTLLPVVEKVHPEVVVDLVQTSQTTANGATFYGLYNVIVPKRCWAFDNKRLLVSSNQKNTLNSYIIDIESKEIVELQYENGSQVIADINNDYVLALRRSFFTRDHLVVAKLPAKGDEDLVEWLNLEEPRKIEALQKFSYRYLDVEHNNNDAVKNFTAIYLGPEEGEKATVPLVVYPHGGPHSNYINGYALEFSMYLLNGFAVLLVNFRGSVGAGESGVKFLLGRVGDTDVKDCLLAAQKCCEAFPWLDSGRMCVSGGSHGGFLAAHLIGQYPDTFRAAVMRNPVIDIASLYFTSDIPDWGIVETTGDEYDQKGPLSEEILVRMRKMSPITYVHKVKAATFLLLGSKDLRVPAFQGVEYYHRLKANGTTVAVNMYDDNHPLGKVPTEVDCVVNFIAWLLNHST